MEPPPWTSPFPPLSLAPDEKNQLIRTAESLIDDVLESYPEFLYECQQPQPSLWSPVKTREDVTVYKSKRPGGGTPNRNVQLLLVVGSVHGTFNDVAYGMLSHTTEAVRIRSAYTQDLLFHGVVLDTVLSPTQEYPFRSMTVRWCAKGLPLYVRAVSKTPDAVLLSATGTRTLATGEVIGFDLVQSVSFSSTPPLPQYDRTSISRCTLWRQISPDRVQVVTRVLWLLEDCLVESAVVKSYADTYVAVGNVTLCAHRKKLVWLVENRKYVRLDYQGRDNASSCCVVCGDPLSSTRLTLKHACAVCTKPTCSKCRIKHDLAYVEPDGQVSHRRTRFCVTCIGYANRLDGEMIAKEEAPSSRPSSTTESVTTT